ncbi:MAG TPA: DUF3556 domain-containing protein, partial [Solirubrobacteraceae bacterium]|nr:DUF3556 domain-containing protein [Solirubrobacteraceae bacterium]
RLKTLSRHWAEYGFGAPKITTLIYVAKLVLFYALGGVLVSTLTSHLNPLLGRDHGGPQCQLCRRRRGDRQQ